MKNRLPIPLLFILLFLIVTASFSCTVYNLSDTPTPTKTQVLSSETPPILPTNTQISITETKNPIPGDCYVGNTEGDLLNFRMGAGREFAIMTGLIPGTKVIVLEEINREEETWFRVRIGETEGYVFGKYCVK